MIYDDSAHQVRGIILQKSNQNIAPILRAVGYQVEII